MIHHLTRQELAPLPVGAVVMLRGKELQVDAAPAEARRLFRSAETLVVPVLEGARYVGALDRPSLDARPDAARVADAATASVPTATASTPTAVALDALDRHGGTRLVVVADDGSTYVGLVCLRTDRTRLCVDGARLDAHLDSGDEHPRKEPT